MELSPIVIQSYIINYLPVPKRSSVKHIIHPDF